MSDDDDRPSTFLGRLRNQKVLTWVVIVGLIVLVVGAGTIAAIIAWVIPGL